MELSDKQNMISQLFTAFSKSRFNFEHFQKYMILIADVLLNFPTPKNVVT